MSPSCRRRRRNRHRPPLHPLPAAKPNPAAWGLDPTVQAPDPAAQAPDLQHWLASAAAVNGEEDERRSPRAAIPSARADTSRCCRSCSHHPRRRSTQLVGVVDRWLAAAHTTHIRKKEPCHHHPGCPEAMPAAGSSNGAAGEEGRCGRAAARWESPRVERCGGLTCFHSHNDLVTCD